MASLLSPHRTRRHMLRWDPASGKRPILIDGYPSRYGMHLPRLLPEPAADAFPIPWDGLALQSRQSNPQALRIAACNLREPARLGHPSAS